MNTSGLEGPTGVLIRSDGISACYWRPGIHEPQWLKVSSRAERSWRTLLELPVSVASDVTLGSFIRLFDVPDRDLDQELFTTFTSLREGPFRRWVEAVSEPGLPPLPDHVVAAVIDEPFVSLEDGRLTPRFPLILTLVSRGRVEGPDSLEGDVFEWTAGGFPLAQLRDLPLRPRADVLSGAEPEAIRTLDLSFRRLIDVVFSWCPPGNRPSDLRPADRERVFDEMRPCTESLEELLGIGPEQEE
jgi:hypothetical protein